MVDGSTAIGGFSDIKSGFVGVENRGKVTSAQIGALKSVLSQGSPASGGTTTLPGPASGQVSSTADTPVVNTPTPESIINAFKTKTPEAAKAVLYDALGKELCNNVSTAQAQWSGAQSEDNKVLWLKAANALSEKSNELMGQLANNPTAPQALKDTIAGLQWLPNISDDYIINNISSFSAAEVKLAQTVAPRGRDTSLGPKAEQAKLAEIQAKIQAKIQPKLDEIQADITNLKPPATQHQIKAIKDKVTNLLKSAEGLKTEQKEYLTKLSEASTLEQLKAVTISEQIKADAKNLAINELKTLYSDFSSDFQALSKARTELAKNDSRYATLVSEWLTCRDSYLSTNNHPSGHTTQDDEDNALKAYDDLECRTKNLARYEQANFGLSGDASCQASLDYLK